MLFVSLVVTSPDHFFSWLILQSREENQQANTVGDSREAEELIVTNHKEHKGHEA